MKITVSKNNNILNVVDLGELVYLGEQSSFFIGRSKDCHVFLDDKKISREQAKIEFKGKSWEISNLSPYLNITVNHAPVMGAVTLNENDTIQIDSFSLAVSELVITEPAEPEVEDVTEVSTEVEATETMFDTPELIPEEEEMTQTEVSTEEDEIDAELLNRDDEEAPTEGNTQFVSLDELSSEEDEFSDQAEGEGEDFGGEYSEEGYEDYGEDYGDGEYDVAEYDEGGGDAGESTQLFSGFAKFSLELFGEHVPYDTYNITLGETFIGRDPEKCQIVLQDPEVSSVHAVIKKNNITCTLEDLQSANGTLLNGKRINTKEVTNGDEFVIGGSTFTVRVGSEFIDSQKDSLMPVEENQVVEVEEVLEVDEDDEDFDDILEEGEEAPAAASKAGGLKAMWNDPAGRKKLMIYGAVLAGILMFIPTEEEGKKTAPKKGAKQEKVAKPTNPNEKKLTKEQAEEAESLYQLAQSYLSEKKYPEAMAQLDKLFLIKKDYKQGQQIYQIVKDELAKLEKAEEERRLALEKAKRKKQVADLLEKAKVAVDERSVSQAKDLFSKIRSIDPENYDVTSLELELNDWVKEKQRKELEEAQKKAERNRMVNALKPAKNLYLREEWFNAIGALEKFLREKDMDQDLVTEATEMLKDAKVKLSEVVNPLLGKARSLREGEDLKGAYGAYNDVLKYDPTLSEALNELDDIRMTLTKRSRSTYREALVAESLGLFEEAKEKYQEVQQIAPSDNEYYKKATDRLRDL
ncbi:FHA domain-containing protein [Bacteriovorax sp. DB6_IX]|uniref:FHA domain-containing protein n=1 Tax=Bacteriovorax sp. DB6_IX TaxID=1353530 RepID=UPI00038A4588|nr:FHA domain-containing protein [Bacteriovorax sp. DB6_IX]EQC51270.1 FHA domain protein [Bacteriovorax sp. DB6_IX]